MYEQEYQAGQEFSDLLDKVGVNRQLWQDIYRRATIAPEAVARASRFADQVRLLIVSEDWCGDAVSLVPFIGRLAEEAGLDHRIIERDRYPQVIDAHLTRGARSIPIAILLDREFRELDWWGPRPGPLQDWFFENGKTLPPPDRYREIRRWYANDRGKTTVEEIVSMIERGAGAREAAA
jgi:hypothetical protein